MKVNNFKVIRKHCLSVLFDLFIRTYSVTLRPYSGSSYIQRLLPDVFGDICCCWPNMGQLCSFLPSLLLLWPHNNIVANILVCQWVFQINVGFFFHVSALLKYRKKSQLLKSVTQAMHSRLRVNQTIGGTLVTHIQNL